MRASKLSGELSRGFLQGAHDTPETLAALQAEYRRLRQRLARIGYISQGSVQQRTVATSGRSGYQWTRKVAQKTVSVALSPPQYEAMKQAVANERELWKGTFRPVGAVRSIRTK
jgi:hypothetical protein